MRTVKRLKSIVSLINDNSKVVADIGADHGYLSKILIEENRAKKVIATDISEPSLRKTDNLIKQFMLTDRIETRVGDGLIPIKNGEVQTVVIAGMGGYEIIKILQSNTDKNIEKFILQPVQNTLQLREFLLENNYKIINDFIVKDKEKFYNTIEVEFCNSKQKLNKEHILFGVSNFSLKTKDFYDYLKIVLEKEKNILDKNPGNVEHQNIYDMAKKTLNDLYEKN